MSAPPAEALRFLPLTPDRIGDLATLFDAGGDPKWCWYQSQVGNCIELARVADGPRRVRWDTPLVDSMQLPDDYAEFRDSVLTDASDDWLGVYEVWWEANSRYPAMPLSQRLSIAEQVVRDLIEEGSARLVTGSWSPPVVKRLGEHPRTSLTTNPIPADQVSARLAAWVTWVPQDDEDAVFLVTTGS